MCIIFKVLLLFMVVYLSFVSGDVNPESIGPAALLKNADPSNKNGAFPTWRIIPKYEINTISTVNGTSPMLQSVSHPRKVEDRGGAGLILLGYFVKGCIYFYTYFKLICVCMGVSLLFLLLCPLLPFLIPALILILLVAVGLSIAIPLIVAATGGDEDLLLVTN